MLGYTVTAIAQPLHATLDVTGIINYANVSSERCVSLWKWSPSFIHRIKGMTSRFVNVSINIRGRAHV